VGDISCSRCSVSARSQLLGLEDPFKTVAPRCSNRDPGQTGSPAEFEHINKRRRRNLQGLARAHAGPRTHADPHSRACTGSDLSPRGCIHQARIPTGVLPEPWVDVPTIGGRFFPRGGDALHQGHASSSFTNSGEGNGPAVLGSGLRICAFRHHGGSP